MKTKQQEIMTKGKSDKSRSEGLKQIKILLKKDGRIGFYF